VVNIPGICSNSFTKIANDWHLVLAYECIDRAEALYIEKFIKRMKSKIFIEKIVTNPQIITDILSKKQLIHVLLVLP
jgi:putative endonuclease